MSTVTLPKISEFGAGLLARGGDVLANDQAIANFLNGANLDQTNISASMTPTWTGIHTHSNNLKIINGYDILGYSDSGSTQTFQMDSNTGSITTSGSVTVAQGQKVILDAIGDMYLQRSAVNNLGLFVGAVEVLKVIGGAANYIYSPSCVVADGGKVCFNGSTPVGNTFCIYKDGSSAITISAAGGFHTFSNSNFIPHSHIRMDDGASLLLDGQDSGTSAYYIKKDASSIGIVAANQTLTIDGLNAKAIFGIYNIRMEATKRLYFASDEDTYIYESSGNTIDIVTGSTISASFTSSNLSTRDIIPLGSNAIGSSGARWTTAYFNTGGIYIKDTSDWRIYPSASELVISKDGSDVVKLDSTNGISTNGGTTYYKITAAADGNFTDSGFSTPTYVEIIVNGTTYRLDGRRV